MANVLARIHSLDLGAAKLQDLGEHGNYIQQQVETWTKQYRAVETQVIPAMERLIQWLPLHFPESQKTTVVHGDFRMDHLVFHPDRPEVLAVLGWKFATLGDPMCDLANNCMSFFLPAHFGARRGLRQCDLGHLGIPTAEEYSQMYCGHLGVQPPESWNFYLAFAFFRLAVTLQGRHRGSLAGRPAPGDSSPKDAEFVAELAWDFAIKEGFRVFENLPPTKLLVRHSSTWAGQGPVLGRSYSTWAGLGSSCAQSPPGQPPQQPGDGPGALLQDGKHGQPVGLSKFPLQRDCTSSARAAGTECQDKAVALMAAQAVDQGTKLPGAKHLHSADPSPALPLDLSSTSG